MSSSIPPGLEPEKDKNEINKVPPVFKTEEERKLINRMKAFNGLPFAVHDLIDHELSSSFVVPTLQSFVENDIISGYGPLIEDGLGMVAQAENSVLVDIDGKVTITTR